MVMKWFVLNNIFLKKYEMKMKWKVINNEIMQWKTINNADKANLPSKHFQLRITIQDTKIFFVGQP